jgi:hypothetical protein
MRNRLTLQSDGYWLPRMATATMTTTMTTTAAANRSVLGQWCSTKWATCSAFAHIRATPTTSWRPSTREQTTPCVSAREMQRASRHSIQRRPSESNKCTTRALYPRPQKIKSIWILVSFVTCHATQVAFCLLWVRWGKHSYKLD